MFKQKAWRWPPHNADAWLEIADLTFNVDFGTIPWFMDWWYMAFVGILKLRHSCPVDDSAIPLLLPWNAWWTILDESEVWWQEPYNWRLFGEIGVRDVNFDLEVANGSSLLPIGSFPWLSDEDAKPEIGMTPPALLIITSLLWVESLVATEAEFGNCRRVLLSWRESPDKRASIGLLTSAWPDQLELKFKLLKTNGSWRIARSVSPRIMGGWVKGCRAGWW